MEGYDRRLFLVCCIYHRPRRFDESSDEESSGTESSEDEGTARPSGQYRGRRHHHGDDRDRCGELGRNHLGDRDRNAYERSSPSKGKGKSK